MVEVAAVASAYDRQQRALSRRIAAEVARQWRRLDQRFLDHSWNAAVGPRILAAVISGQMLAAAAADDYLDRALDAQNIDPDAAGAVAPRLLSGVASDGRDLASLLYEPVIAVKTAIGQGADITRVMTGGLLSLDMITRTQLADAGRVATGVGITARRHVDGYVRMLNPPSCSRCAILAGRWYRWNAGFRRHPRCLPAGVAVSGPRTVAATRRWYQGELVVITTAAGQELPITGNHPVLTDRGWVPAHLLQEGDHVVRSLHGQGAVALMVPDKDQMPSLVEDVWRSNGMMPLGQMPTSAEDFHGDGGKGQVDVVLADSLLRHGMESASREFANQEELSWRVGESSVFALLRATDEVLDGLLLPTHGIVGGLGLGATLLRRHPTSAHSSGRGPASSIYASSFEMALDHSTAHPVAESEAVFALSSSIRGDEVAGRQRVVGDRWDPPAGPLTVESSLAYASRGRDLLRRLAGQVELDRVVELRRTEWSGHVYNLMSTEGWFAAQGLIVSNCDCRQIPSSEDTAGDLTTDPKAYFASLSQADQDRLFTKAGAQAIRDGADMNQVVNIRREGALYTAGGRKLTREGTTSRGFFGGYESGPNGEVRRRSDSGLVKRGGRYRQSRQARLTPEQIYADAHGDRDEAIRLLREYGFLV